MQRRILRHSLAALAVASCFAAGNALANPTGPTVTHGTAVFQQSGGVLQITNSPNAIINWQGFSIGGNELTCFIQNSATSAVLNRVITQNPSQILGALQSNGRVFLMNPSGIVFGPNSRIDVSGLIASTLNLSDTDFLTGRMRFTETPGAGSLVNQGTLTAAPGGTIYLVAPDVTNTGLITSPNGEVVLAAGKTVELMDPGTPYLRVEVTAPDNQALNLGRIAAESGRVGIFAGLIAQRGAINAGSATVAESGKVVLKAVKNTTLEAGSVTTASGPSGGKIEIQSGDTTLVAGVVEAKGTAGQGGTVQVLGERVGLIGSASVDVSGATGGGAALVGGDRQGRNPDIQNASRTTITSGASIRADATDEGDGGKVIAWSDEVTRFFGQISARGGPRGGDGGFVEVSGKDDLVFRGKVSLSAPFGRGGTLLLDPADITLVAAGGTLDVQLSGTADPNLLFADGGANSTLTVGELTAGFASGDTIALQATNNVNFGLPVTLQPGVNLSITPDADANGAGAFNLSANLTAGNLTVSGRMNHTAGTLSIASGSVTGLVDYSSPGNLAINGGALALAGGMNWSGTGNITGAGAAPAVTVPAGATLSLAGGGTRTVSGADLTVGGTANSSGGTTLEIAAGAVLQGGGTINADVTNTAGTVAPGVSPGALTIAGNYTQGAGGAMNVEIQGTTPGTQHDVLRVTGNASLDGTLNAALTGGFAPIRSETVNVIEYGSVTGRFATTNLPAGATDAYAPTQYQVTLAALPPPAEVSNEATREVVVAEQRVTSTQKAAAEPRRYARLDESMFSGCRQLDTNVYFCR